MSNQNPEQITRNKIDKPIMACGSAMQDKNKSNLTSGIGLVVCGYNTEISTSNYILYVPQKPFGILEANLKEERINISTRNSQVSEYAKANLNLFDNLPNPHL